MPKWFFHPLSILGFIIVAVWLYISLLKTEQKMRRSTESVSVLDQEVAEIAREVSELEMQLKLASSAAAQEKIIRDELLMQKPGEYVIQLPELETEAKPTPTPLPTPETPRQEWRQLLTPRFAK